MNNYKTILTKIQNGEALTLDFVGDSVTRGINHCTDEETYVARFAAYMAEKFAECAVNRYDGIAPDELLPIDHFEGPKVISKGHGGATIDIIRNGVGGNTVLRAHKRIDNFTGTLANGKRPDLTFMMFGINDSLIHVPDRYATPEVFKENYRNLINAIKEKNPETLFIIMTPTTNDKDVSAHAEKVRELGAEEGIAVIDTNALWSEHYDPSADNFGHGDWLKGGRDACHPTPVGADATGKFVFDQFVKLIEADK